MLLKFNEGNFFYFLTQDSKAESNLPLPGYTVDKPTLVSR